MLIVVEKGGRLISIAALDTAALIILDHGCHLWSCATMIFIYLHPSVLMRICSLYHLEELHLLMSY